MMTQTYTYAGHPSVIDTTANTVHPFPCPSAPNIAGANRGNPKPARVRRQNTTASAVKQNGKDESGTLDAKDPNEPEAACSVKTSITYVCVD